MDARIRCALSKAHERLSGVHGREGRAMRVALAVRTWGGFDAIVGHTGDGVGSAR